MPPPNQVAALPDRVLPLTVTLNSLQMPPPTEAELPDRVLSLTVSVAVVVDAAAVSVGGVAGEGAAADRQRPGSCRCRRRCAAELPDRVLSLTVTVPAL